MSERSYIKIGVAGPVGSGKTALIERLRTYLDSMSRKSLLEKKAAESDAQNKTLGQAPMTIFIG